MAWLLCGLALALLTATLLLLLVGRPPATPAADRWQRQAADLLTLVGPPLLGGVVAARRPNRYGWLWLAVGLLLAVQAFAMAYAAVAQAAGPAGPPGLAVAAWTFGLTFTAFLSLFPFVFLLFPTGRLPSRRWRPWARAIILIGALMLVVTALVPGTAVEGVVLRYRLFEIDRLVNRTLVYGTLTALLGLVYAAGVFGLEAC